MKVDIRHQGHQAVFRERLYELIHEYPELTWQRTFEEAYSAIAYATESLDEWAELVVRDEHGVLIGFAIATDDDDDHVGPVLGVQWRIVFPEAPKGTCMMLQRGLIKLARECNYNVIAYTRRLCEGRYEVKYQKLKEVPNGQENQEGR